MRLIGIVTVPLTIVFAILAFYWWFNYAVLERAIQRALSPPADDCRGGWLAQLLVLVAVLTLSLMFLLEVSGL